MEQLLFAGIAVLVTVVQILTLARILSVYRNCQDRLAECSRSPNVEAAIESLEARALEIARHLEVKSTGIQEQLERRASSAIQEMMPQVPDTAAISERVASVENEINGLKENAKRFVKIKELAKASEEIRDELQSISGSLHSTVEAVREYAEKAAAVDESALEERLVSVEKVLSEFLASAEAHGTFEDLSGIIRNLQQELEATRQNAEQARTIAAQMSELAGRLPAVENSVREIMDEVAVWRVTFEGLRKELNASRSRNRTGAAEPALRAATSRAAQQPQNGQRPKVISPEARARYKEVLDLWSQGNSIGDISSATGLDLSEVELMLAGERPPAQAAGEQ